MQKKTDRRVRKTKSQLKTGLAQLMREKSIQRDYGKRIGRCGGYQSFYLLSALF